MKHNEMLYWALVAIAWALGIITFWNTLNWFDGIFGSMSLLAAANAVYVLYKGV